MPPPPVTPTPRRFVIRREGATHGQDTARPRIPLPSQARPISTGQTPTQSQGNTSRHFNTTPKFSFASTQRNASSHDASAVTPASSSRFAIPSSSRLREYKSVVVEDVDSQEDTQPQENHYGGLDSDGEEREQDYERSPPPIKRRRISISIANSDDEKGYIPMRVPGSSAPDKSSDSDAFEEDEQNRTPSEPAQHEPEPSSSLPDVLSPSSRPWIPPSTSRFLRSPTQKIKQVKAEASENPTTTSHANSKESFTRVPRFKQVEEVASPGPTDPLPEIFSPHRKGQKYLPGGLTAQTRDWLLQLEFGSAEPVKASRGDVATTATYSLLSCIGPRGHTALIHIDSLRRNESRNWLLVMGRQVNTINEVVETGEADEKLKQLVKVVLAGPGSRSVLEPALSCEVCVGSIVEVKRPVWEVCLGREVWGVCVDYTVLS